jgi:large repetitive protein
MNRPAVRTLTLMALLALLISSALSGTPIDAAIHTETTISGGDLSAPVVTMFAAPASSASLIFPITAFTASDDIAVSGYLISLSATPPQADAAGWSAAAPIAYTVTSDGTYTLYPWAKDAAGNVSVAVGSPATVRVDTAAPTVNTFAAATPSASLSILITAFTASDTAGVTGYLITESSTPPSIGAAGWSSSAPITYVVAGDGAYTLYPWAKDAAGNISAAFGAPATVSVDASAPIVLSSVRADPNPTTAGSLHFVVTFSEAVSGVDAADFSLTTTGSISGAAISGVSGSGATYTVTITRGSGPGSIRLDVADNDSIQDAAFNPLGGVGAGNGAFAGGEPYTIDLQLVYLPLVALP